MPRGLKIILVLSLVANLGLGFAYFRFRHPTNASPRGATVAALPPTSSLATDWQALTAATANDDQAYVTRLRAEGFPPAVIRTLLANRISERFAPQRRALEEASGEYTYWKGWSSINAANTETRAALRKLHREQSALLRQLLGEEDAYPMETAYNVAHYGKLSREKVEQLELIDRDYDDLIEQIRREARGLLLPDDREKLSFLIKERQADLAAILTPAELEAYSLRSSQTAQQLKSRLQLFDATEQEYKALYTLQKTYDDQFANPAIFGDLHRSREELKAQGKAADQLKKDIEAALGPARYRDYQIATDYEYRRVLQLAERLNLPASAARSVLELKLDTAARIKALGADKSLDRQQREAQLNTLVQTVTDQLTQHLGPEGLASYRASGGHWIPKNSTPSQPAAATNR